MSPEDLLSSRLESIKDSITNFKYATDTHLNRLNKLEADLADCKIKIADLSDFRIAANQQLASIAETTKAMSADIRSVRNSVLSAIFVALIIWVTGTALSATYVNKTSTSSIMGKAA